MDSERLSHPGTVAEGSRWTFPGKYRIWARVPEPALLSASHIRARQPGGPGAAHSPSSTAQGGLLPRRPPQGNRGSHPAGSCQAFHPKPVPCIIQSANKRNDRHSKITFSSRGESRRRLAAGLAREVPAEERSFLG